MQDNTLFIRALLANLDRLKELLGDDWVKIRDELLRLLTELVGESDERKLAGRTNRIYRALENTLAVSLVHRLFREASVISEIPRRTEEDQRIQHERVRRAEEMCRSEQERQHTPTKPDKEILEQKGPEELKFSARELAGAIAAEPERTPSEQVLPSEQPLRAESNLGESESGVQREEKRINTWISERVAEPSRPLQIGEHYTLNLGVGKEIVGSLITGKDATVPAQDLTGGGLQTEWVISTAAFEVSSDDPTIALASETPNIQTAKFSLWIPEKGDSELKRLFIVPRCQDNARLQILVFAVRASRRELYRQFAIEVPVEGSVNTAAPVSGAAIVNECICAPSGHMNLQTTHEWTTPPGRLTLTVLPGLQKAYVNGDLPGRQVNDFVDWYGQQATMAGLIDNLRDEAEKFRGKWQDYLNDIDTQDLATRLSQFAPTYDWAHWQSRADAPHAKNWLDASTSDELRALAIHGRVLYETVFPPGKQLRSWIDSLPPGTRLDITWKVDEPGSGNVPNVPWGMMYQGDPPAPGEAVDPMGFLALRFRLGYWGYQGVSDASKALGALAKAHQAYCLYWGNHPKDETGVEAAWQRQQFQQWQNQIFVPETLGSPNAYAEVLQAFAAPKRSPTSVLYFFCQAAVGDGNKPVLRFGATSAPVDVLQTTDLLIGKPLLDQPLVFANACTTSSADPYIANLLQQTLFRRGCRAFLGTETKVPIQLASRFAAIFFNFFYRRIDTAPMAAGEALAQTRLFLLTEYANIGGIFYTYLNQYELYMASDSEVQALRLR